MRTAPRRPENIPEFALACLKNLVDSDLVDRIVLGGGLDLLHYLDLRLTVALGSRGDVISFI